MTKMVEKAALYNQSILVLSFSRMFWTGRLCTWTAIVPI